MAIKLEMLKIAVAGCGARPATIAATNSDHAVVDELRHPPNPADEHLNLLWWRRLESGTLPSAKRVEMVLQQLVRRSSRR